MHTELLVVLVVIITILLIIGKEMFVWRHHGYDYDALCLGITGATETLD